MLSHMFQLMTLWDCGYVCTWYVDLCVVVFFLFVCFFVVFLTEEYNTSIQEKLPLIIGSAAAGLVFLIAVVVIIIVCNR